MFPRWLRVYEALFSIWTAVATPRLAALSEYPFLSERLRVYEAGVGERLFASVIDELGTTSGGELASPAECLTRL